MGRPNLITLALGMTAMLSIGTVTADRLLRPRRTASNHDAAINLLLAFIVAFGIVRLVTWVIRRRKGHGLGPIRDLKVGTWHIHHFIPGILLTFVSGGGAIVLRHERLHPILAVPFGIGMALILDESALLLELKDVYWSEEGIISVQITLATTSLLALLALVLRAKRRSHH
jgi:hypothetical protein